MGAARSDEVLAERVGVLGKITVGEIADLAQTWTTLAGQWSAPPVQVGTTSAGAVYAYTAGGVTRYRLVPAPYAAAQDAFYSNFTGGVLSGLIIARG